MISIMFSDLALQSYVLKLKGVKKSDEILLITIVVYETYNRLKIFDIKAEIHLCILHHPKGIQSLPVDKDNLLHPTCCLVHPNPKL